jgi:hypothetical protein
MSCQPESKQPTTSRCNSWFSSRRGYARILALTAMTVTSGSSCRRVAYFLAYAGR